MFRRVAKRFAEKTLRALRGDPSRMAGCRLVLAYHNIVAEGQPPAGDRPLHLPVDAFRRQLDLLEQHCEVVSLLDIMQPSAADRPRVAITFDDGYHGAVTLGLPEVARRNLPVTVFLTPGRFGHQGFWWDLLSGPDGLPESVRSQALDAHQGREELIQPRTRELPASHGCATEALVRGAVTPRVTYGAHTWTHPNLARLEPSLLEEELRRPLEWFASSGLPVIPWLAYPYGLTDAAVIAAARRLGYHGGVLVEGGWLTERADPFEIPRYNVPAALSEDGLLLRLAGTVAL